MLSKLWSDAPLNSFFEKNFSAENHTKLMVTPVKICCECSDLFRPHIKAFKHQKVCVSKKCHKFIFKGTVKPVQNGLKVVWLDRPWLGHPSL